MSFASSHPWAVSAVALAAAFYAAGVVCMFRRLMSVNEDARLWRLPEYVESPAGMVLLSLLWPLQAVGIVWLAVQALWEVVSDE